MKGASVVWIKCYDWEDGEKIELNRFEKEIMFYEPDYDLELYKKYVLIPLED